MHVSTIPEAMQGAAHEPEERRQALKDRKPLLPDASSANMDTMLAEQVECMISMVSGEGDADVIAVQAKAGL